jgi:hypothetical protein
MSITNFLTMVYEIRLTSHQIASNDKCFGTNICENPSHLSNMKLHGANVVTMATIVMSPQDIDLAYNALRPNFNSNDYPKVRMDLIALATKVASLLISKLESDEKALSGDKILSGEKIEKAPQQRRKMDSVSAVGARIAVVLKATNKPRNGSLKSINNSSNLEGKGKSNGNVFVGNNKLVLGNNSSLVGEEGEEVTDSKKRKKEENGNSTTSSSSSSSLMSSAVNFISNFVAGSPNSSSTYTGTATSSQSFSSHFNI